MARGRKKETLTPEERLQAALVPESEQPYPVPGNWCWAYLTKGAAECLDSFRKPINASERANREGDIPYYGATGQVGWIDDFLTNEQLVLVGEDGAPFLDVIKDKAYIIEGKAWVNNHAHILRSRFGAVGNLFLMHYLNIFNYHDFVNGTTRLKLTQGSMDTMPVPLPPLPEQQRIVDRIESLFARLDEAKQKAQDALDSFETRKAAILHKAFTGDLTAQWRKERGVGMESWKNVSVSEICHSLKYGTAKKSSSEGTVVVIRMGNLQDGEINWDDLAYSNDEEDIEKFKLVPGDVLFNRTNSPALVGKTSIYRGEYPAIYAGYLIKLGYDRSRIIGDYLNYSLNTISAKEHCNSVKTDGVNQSNINAKKIGAYVFTMPKINEQTEIVRILDNLLAKERQAKEAAEGVLEQIGLIKKAILARAFRGELGTNDPSDESEVLALLQCDS
ncbi:restriction endonuclease subunit S [Anaerotruncus colihominis]|uniref:restriction endonuclease subunit S n=1 Tax=Anaerotruncus colihominis TaxID=169435 RepID=UPI003516E478